MIVQEQEPQTPLRPKRALHTARIQLKVHCGCGENFSELSTGLEHAESSSHTLTITGEIRVQK